MFSWRHIPSSYFFKSKIFLVWINIASLVWHTMKMWKKKHKKNHQCCARRMLTQLRHRDRSRSKGFPTRLNWSPHRSQIIFLNTYSNLRAVGRKCLKEKHQFFSGCAFAVWMVSYKLFLVFWWKLVQINSKPFKKLL